VGKPRRLLVTGLPCVLHALLLGHGQRRLTERCDRHAPAPGIGYRNRCRQSQLIAALRNALRRVAAEAVRFSIREDQIIRFSPHGETHREIAVSLKISERTVKNHMRS
jgi:DNA-binding CsgD family transcriptional regulator